MEVVIRVTVYDGVLMVTDSQLGSLAVLVRISPLPTGEQTTNLEPSSGRYKQSDTTRVEMNDKDTR